MNVAETHDINDVLVVGVGGQGVLLATDILADVFLAVGSDVRKSEVHGMAQRGGSVESHVRRGPVVHSPLIRRGRADVLLSMEVLEALRYLHWLRPGGVVLTSLQRIVPASVAAGGPAYPDTDGIIAQLRAHAGRCAFIDPGALVAAAGDVRTMNVGLIGALSVFVAGVPAAIWEQVMAARVPARALDANRRAFALGRHLAENAPA
jgi:indolepyruvate ferredoxin oxidoreductase beta subunit